MAPTLVEGVAADAELARTELFGPITTLHRVARLRGGARRWPTRRPYGLTAAIWTVERPPRRRSSSRRVVSGRRPVNGPTYGSEPHMPFGGQRRLGQRLARARHRGARRLLGLEDRLRHPRPGRGRECPTRRRAGPGARRLASASPARTSAQLAGHPLIAYSIAAAHESGVFDAVVVSTDSRGDRRRRAPLRRRGARRCARRRWRRRPRPTSSGCVHARWLRPTAERAVRDPAADEPVPQRRRRSGAPASSSSRSATGADSIRAVELCSQHPGKMWIARRRPDAPAARRSPSEVPLHSRQYQALPQVYVQNSSLEIAWTRVLDGARRRSPARASRRSSPRALEGFSIDYPDDFERAERLVASGEGQFPHGKTGFPTDVGVLAAGAHALEPVAATRLERKTEGRCACEPAHAAAAGPEAGVHVGKRPSYSARRCVVLLPTDAHDAASIPRGAACGADVSRVGSPRLQRTPRRDRVRYGEDVDQRAVARGMVDRPRSEHAPRSSRSRLEDVPVDFLVIPPLDLLRRIGLDPGERRPGRTRRAGARRTRPRPTRPTAGKLRVAPSSASTSLSGRARRRVASSARSPLRRAARCEVELVAATRFRAGRASRASSRPIVRARAPPLRLELGFGGVARVRGGAAQRSGRHRERAASAIRGRPRRRDPRAGVANARAGNKPSSVRSTTRATRRHRARGASKL